MSGRVAFGFFFGLRLGRRFVTAAGRRRLAVAGHDGGQEMIAFE
jgi:hypothetical protein